MSDDKSCGDIIKQLRKSHHWSQTDLAQRLQVTFQMVSKWEVNECTPNGDKLIKLSEIFSVTTDYILGISTKKVLVVEELSDFDIATLQSLVNSLKSKKQPPTS